MSGPEMTLEKWKLDKLKNYIDNASLYGQLNPENADDVSFIASVQDRGVRAPPIIAADGTILAGHRRFQAARRAGVKEMYVNVCRTVDPNDAAKPSNRRRDGTSWKRRLRRQLRQRSGHLERLKPTMRQI
jgi:hypothetical protein